VAFVGAGGTSGMFTDAVFDVLDKPEELVACNL
jgi:hypothetical protein